MLIVVIRTSFLMFQKGYLGFLGFMCFALKVWNVVCDGVFWWVYWLWVERNVGFKWKAEGVWLFGLAAWASF